MKKSLLIPALIASIAMATEYNWEITPLAGINMSDDKTLSLNANDMYGVEIQYNGYDFPLKPELSYTIGEADLSYPTALQDDAAVKRVALNGVYDFDKIDKVTPLFKTGIGYEDIEGGNDTPFFDIGLGVKAPFTDSIALKLEALYILSSNASNLALLAGLNFSFGEKAQKEVPVAAAVAAPIAAPITAAVIDGDDDNDGIKNSLDKCPNSPTGKTVNTEGCFVDGDDDKDSVLNASDKCPNSPLNAKVDKTGCPIMLNLHVNFALNSAVVDTSASNDIQKFADFLNMYPHYNANIVGHTDNYGTESYNQSLSEERANAVKEIIIQKGIQPNRIFTSGKGETSPIASNDNQEDRLKNRRIEAELIKQ